MLAACARTLSRVSKSIPSGASWRMRGGSWALWHPVQYSEKKAEPKFS